MIAPDPTRTADLLGHLDFVRALARDLLVGDGDDLCQDAMVVALQHAPREPSRLRHWLAVVVRNLARNVRRRSRRQAMRLRALPALEAAASAADVQAREEVRRRVVQQVLELGEPYRATVLAVYFEGLSCAAIARRADVPEATVRSRLRRGLALLRGRLDDVHGGDRAAWSTPLLALARGPGEGPTPFGPAVGDASRRWLSSQQALVATVLVVPAVLLAVWWLTSSAAEATEAAQAGAAVEAAPPLPEVGVPSTPVRAEVQVRAVDLGATYPGVRRLGTLRVRVCDEAGAAAPAVSVSVRPTLGSLPPAARVVDDRTTSRNESTDSAGEVRFDALPEGPYRVEAQRAGEAASATVALAAGGAEDLVLALRADAERERLVVEAVDGARVPVPGARLEVVGLGDRATVGMDDAAPAFLTADAHGRAVFDKDELVSGIVMATSGGLSGWTPIESGSRRATVVLTAPGSLAGRLDGDGADDLALAVVQVHALDHPLLAHHVAHGRTWSAKVVGRSYRFPSLPPGTYVVTLAATTPTCLALPPRREQGLPQPNAVQPMVVSVRAGEDAQLDLDLRAGACIDGRVVDAEGRPVPGARVLASLIADATGPVAGDASAAPLWRLDGPDYRPHQRPHPSAHVEGTAGADGRYVLAGLQPGRHRLEVRASGWSYDRREVELSPGGRLAQAHELMRDGVLQVALPAGVGSVAVRRQGRDTFVYLAHLRDEVTTVPGLAAGVYEVLECDRWNGRGERRLGEVLVEAGRTTWLDLRAAAFPHRGLVVDANGPVAGVRVGFAFPGIGQTDGSGRFAFAYAFHAPRHSGALTLRLGGATWRVPVTRAQMPAPDDFGVLLLPSCVLDVRTVGADGRGAPARVRAQSGDATSGRETSSSVVSDSEADGRLRLERLANGRCTVSATFADGTVVRGVVELPASGPLTLRALPAGDLEVAVSDVHGTPLAFAIVQVRRVSTGPEGGDIVGSGVTGSDGRALLRGLAAGEFTIHGERDERVGSQRCQVAPRVTAQVGLELR
ncbi:MAG: sigma-70 family RNA polymerase sigma factor [Planctomycetota bacterium]